MTYNVLMGTLNPTHSLTHSLLLRQDFVANSDAVADTSSGGMYEMSQAGVPVNGACPGSLTDRRRKTSVAAQIISNSAAAGAVAAAAAAMAGSGGGGGGPQSSATGGGAAEGAGGTPAGSGGGLSTATEQQLSRMLDKIYETIELNELRLLIQDRKDAVKLEWQQVDCLKSVAFLRGGGD